MFVDDFRQAGESWGGMWLPGAYNMIFVAVDGDVGLVDGV